MTRLVNKARVEILLDEPLISVVLEILRIHGVHNYTLFPTSAGQGVGGTWLDDQITGAQHKVLLLTIVEPQKAENLAKDIEPLLDSYGMIFMLSDVRVPRDSKF